MSRKYFNFNNEVDLTPVEVNDETGHVVFTMDDQTAEFDSLKEFAEFYAVARNVKPENLKNWVLTEDGNQFAFVLRAGTAGLDAEAISNMVSGLRDAGMTPEEIGRAVAAAQSHETETVTVARQTDRNTSLVTELVENLDDASKAILKANREVSTDEELIRNLASDKSLFEYYDEDEDEAFDDDDALDTNITDLIDEEKIELGRLYPNVPAGIAAALKMNLEVDSEGAKQELQKAVVAAHIAKRKVVVTLVVRGDANEDPIIDQTFFNRRTKERLLDYADDNLTYFVEDKHFVIALDGNDADDEDDDDEDDE